jgi:hypothetical protein
MTEIVSASNKDKAILGQGYNTSEEKFTGVCVLGDPIFAGAQDASIIFTRTMSETEVADSLGFSVGGKARYGMITGSLSAKFASESSSCDRSQVSVYSAKYQFKNKKLKYTGLSPQGTQAKGSGADSNLVWENWQKTCGDEYVEQIVQGASLYISIKIEFATRASKSSFDAQFSVSGPMFEVGGTLAIASKQFGKSGSISIQVYQMGGDVAQLSQALGATMPDKPELKAITVCSMENPEACLLLLNSAVTYADKVFPKQIDQKLGEDSPYGPADLSYITKPWSDLAFYNPKSIIADSVRVAREDLSVEFERNLKYRNRYLALQSGFRMSPAQRLKLDHIKEIVTANLKLISDAATVCYSQMDKCVAKVTETKALLKNVNEDDFDIHPETISQWYDIKDLPSTLQEVRSIMERLEGVVKSKFNDWESISKDDKGDLIEKNLAEVEEIDLSGLEISNSDHLSWLPLLKNLTRLDLGKNKITDISPISSLTKLTVIILFENRLTDLSPLASLTKLTSIHLNGNQIIDISPLASLTNLTAIFLGNNQITDISPLASLTKLTTVELGRNRISDVSPLASLVNLTTIWIRQNQINDASPFASLTNLTTVDLYDNQISDVSPFASLTNLTSLSLANNRVTDISSLPLLMQLVTLHN